VFFGEVLQWWCATLLMQVLVWLCVFVVGLRCRCCHGCCILLHLVIAGFAFSGRDEDGGEAWCKEDVSVADL